MKFEFSDIYKFKVSVAIAVIAASILVLGLIFQSNFDLLLKSEDIKELTDRAQSTIFIRQFIIFWATILLPIGCIISISVFSWFALKSLKQWQENQNLLDTKLKTEIEILKASVREQTEDERQEIIAEKELNVISERNFGDTDANFNNISYYQEIENMFEIWLQLNYANDYIIRRNMKLESKFVDFILEHLRQPKVIFIVEVKVIQKGFNVDWLRQSWLKLLSAAQTFQAVRGVDPHTRLLVFMKDSIYTKGYQKMGASIEGNSLFRSDKDRVSIIPVSSLQSGEELSRALWIPLGIPNFKVAPGKS